MSRFSTGLGLTVLGILALTACEDGTPPTAPGAAGETAAPASGGTPAASAPALTLFQVSSGRAFTCAITTDNVPYCWGENRFGQLGIGDTTGPERCQGAFPVAISCSTKPVRVAGNHRFVRVSAGANHACGVTADFEAWCWGGALLFSPLSPSLVPVHVAGFRFRQVDAGDGYTCGVTYPASRLYCWGADFFGRLGTGSVQSSTPIPVLTTLTFRQVSAGQAHTCAITTADKAFCWGNGRYGTLGNGHAYLSFWPRAVAGGLSVRRVTVGMFFSCAETVGNKAYCWGTSFDGELGNGSPVGTVALTPVPVSGNHAF